jgi:hypothetical protein
MQRLISWWSGGIASAVACKLALDEFGDKFNVEIVFIDTYHEHKDTHRFLDDCSKVYGQEIKTISNPRFKSIEEVWRKYKSLNVSKGAICSSTLKKDVRVKYQDKENDFGQIFGFDYTPAEQNRARNMLKNYPDINPLFPLIEGKYTKEKCISEVESWGIELPWAYRVGFRNNNCFGYDEDSIGGCVQGGIGYWQKIQREYPKKFSYMVEMERELSKLKGEAVTMLKDQSRGERNKIFLEHNPDFPEYGNLSQKKGREPESLMECNGFCATDQIDMFEEIINSIDR